MACSGVIRLGDEKTSLQFLIEDCLIDGTKVILDITNAQTMVIRFRHEDGKEEEKPATLYTGGANGDGTDGLVEYITEPEFITEDQDLNGKSGTLQGIAIVTFISSGPYHSSPGKFKVKANF